MYHEFIPKSYLYLRSGYNGSTFRKDLLAGITVGIIALPLSMAFAISSGVSPERGIFTAIIAGFLISLLGGSRVQIGGPTGAFVVLIYHIIQKNGYEGLAVSTCVAALLLILMGVFRLGTWIKYIPHPLITGFTSGIAVLIFSSQIKDFFGLNMGTPPANFVEKWCSYIRAFPSFHLPTLLLSVATLGLILTLRRFFPRVPWGISAILIATLLCYSFQLDVATIQSKFGGIPNRIPLPALPNFSLIEGKISDIVFDGIAIAFLCAIESLLSALIADGMIGGRHKSNCELVGQGIANFGSILFGGIPATGAIARTAANVKTGAETPLAGMIHAITLFFILIFLSPMIVYIPLAALAAILIMVAWNMSEMDHFIWILKSPIEERVVLLSAFFLTVFLDITIAITTAMVLASLFFMKKMSQISKTVPLHKLLKDTSDEFPEKTDPDAITNKMVPEDVEVYEIQGPFFFGVADMLKDLLVELRKPPKFFILRMRHIPYIDASGMYALKEFHSRCQKWKTTLLLSGVQGQLERDLTRFGLNDLIGSQNVFPHIDAALELTRTKIYSKV